MTSDINEKYTTIKLSKEFTVLIDEIMSIKKLGFQSRAEVVKAAVRDYYERLIKLSNES